jgi:hypothetical protein
MGVLSTTGADEFLPIAVAKPPSKPRVNLVADARDAAIEFERSDRSEHFLSVATAKSGASLKLAVYGFVGWKSRTLSGPCPAELGTDAAGLLELRFPTPGKYDVEVRYGTPPAALLGLLLSLVAFSGLGALLLYGSRFWPYPLPSPPARMTDT